MMWWDWTQITLFESILFSILSIFILYLVGFGILCLFSSLSKKSDPFGAFDFFQKANFRVLFGFVFVYLFYYLFAFLNLALFSTLLIICLSFVGISTMFKDRKKWFKRTASLFRGNYFNIAIFSILIAVIILSSMLITGFYGSTIDDGADHTLMTRIVLDNPVSLLTRSGQPFANLILNYPSGAHVLSAFFVSLLNVSIQKIVILISVVLPTLIALAFYSTLKCLFKNRLISLIGLIVASFFAVGFSWGPLSWGGLPVLLSLYLSGSSMGLIFVFLLSKQLSYLNAFLLGLIFFISSQTYPSALLLESLWLVMILIIKLSIIVWHNHLFEVPFSSVFKWKNAAIAVVFLIPMLFSLPYFYSIYTHNIAGVQFTELNSGSYSLAESVIGRTSFNWLLDIPSLSVFFSEMGRVFSLAAFTIILIIVFFIPRLGKKLRNLFPTHFAFNLLLVYSFWSVIMAYLAITLFMPINFLIDFFNPERIWQHVFIVVTIMTTLVIFSCMHLSYLVIRRLSKIKEKSVKKEFSRNRLFAAVLSVLLISTVVFLSVPVIKEQQQTYDKIEAYLNYYTVLGHDDVLLMNWIKTNISSQALFLISRGDSGQYLTAISKQQSFCGYNGIENYTSIMTFLTANSSDLRVIPYLIDNKISYVYVGSKPSSFALDSVIRRPFNASQFLTTPYFNLVKEVGNAWLFEFNASSALKAHTSGTSTQ
jgi:hypothetical protein